MIFQAERKLFLVVFGYREKSAFQMNSYDIRESSAVFICSKKKKITSGIAAETGVDN